MQRDVFEPGQEFHGSSGAWRNVSSHFRPSSAQSLRCDQNIRPRCTMMWNQPHKLGSAGSSKLQLPGVAVEPLALTPPTDHAHPHVRRQSVQGRPRAACERSDARHRSVAGPLPRLRRRLFLEPRAIARQHLRGSRPAEFGLGRRPSRCVGHRRGSFESAILHAEPERNTVARMSARSVPAGSVAEVAKMAGGLLRSKQPDVRPVVANSRRGALVRLRLQPGKCTDTARACSSAFASNGKTCPKHCGFGPTRS